MDITITEQKANPLLERKDVLGTVTFDKVTPSRQELTKQVAAKLKAKEELVIIPIIKTAYGDKSASFEAHVYDKADVIPLIEDRNTRFRHMPADQVKEQKDKLKAAKKERKAKRKKK